MPLTFKPTYPDPPHTPKPAPPVSDEPPTVEQVQAARTALRDGLRALRWDTQGGYPGRRGDGWDFAGLSVVFTPDQLDALFALAGLVADEIKPVGPCQDCVNADDGRERGWAPPCRSCEHPFHSNFVPVRQLELHPRPRGRRAS